MAWKAEDGKVKGAKILAMNLVESMCGVSVGKEEKKIRGRVWGSDVVMKFACRKSKMTGEHLGPAMGHAALLFRSLQVRAGSSFPAARARTGGMAVPKDPQRASPPRRDRRSGRSWWGVRGDGGRGRGVGTEEPAGRPREEPKSASRCQQVSGGVRSVPAGVLPAQGSEILWSGEQPARGHAALGRLR